MAENGCIGWDEDVSEEIAKENHQGNDGFVVLPEGDYTFEVKKVDRTRFEGSDKLPACLAVKVGCLIDGGELGNSYVTKMFFMHTKMLWKIYQFLQAIGLHKSGDGAGPIPWNSVKKGMKATCHVTVYQPKSGKFKGQYANDIESFSAPQQQPTEDLGDEY